MRRSLELGGVAPQHHCRGEGNNKINMAAKEVEEDKIDVVVKVEYLYSALRNAVNRSVFAKTKFIFQIESEKMFDYDITFLVTEFFYFENAKFWGGWTTLSGEKRG